MKVLIVGHKGQLGHSLAATAPPEAEIVGHDVDTLDVTDADAVRACLEEVRPALLFNAAAYTAVDRAEQEEEAAFAVNATAVGVLARAVRRVDGRFVHVSTDFIFDGTSSTPYRPEAVPAPLGVYGRSKWEGEQQAGPQALVVRTAWVYAPTGENFVRTMLRLMAERSEVRVVADQIGTPTYAPGLAAALWQLATAGAIGTYHYTDSGVASWYDFAVAIQEEALAAGLLTRAVPIVPIATCDYPTPARRPHYSVLDKRSTVEHLGRNPPHWRDNLRAMLAQIKVAG